MGVIFFHLKPVQKIMKIPIFWISNSENSMPNEFSEIQKEFSISSSETINSSSKIGIFEDKNPFFLDAKKSSFKNSLTYNILIYTKILKKWLFYWEMAVRLWMTNQVFSQIRIAKKCPNHVWSQKYIQLLNKMDLNFIMDHSNEKNWFRLKK